MTQARFLSPDGGPAVWRPDLERVRLSRIADDDHGWRQRQIEKAARIGTMLREGVSATELAGWISGRTIIERARQFGVSLETPLGYTKRGAPIFPIMGAAERIFTIANSSVATTAAPVKQPTGSAIRTMLQIEVPSTLTLTGIEWGISFDGVTATAVPGQVELFTTTVAATMSTASVAADVAKVNQPSDLATNITFTGTTHTGFATAAVTEGTVANYRLLDLQLIAPTTGYVKQWPLGREPMIDVSTFIRCRVTFAATVNAYNYVTWSE